MLIICEYSMKKILSVLTLSMLATVVANASTTSTTSAPATPAGNFIAVHGEIVQSTCAVSSGSKLVTVQMPQYTTNDFKAGGLQADKSKNFEIVLEGCPLTYSTTSSNNSVNVAKNVYVSFADTKNSSAASKDTIISKQGNLANRLKNNRGPSNLEVQLATVLDGTVHPVDLYNNPNGKEIPLSKRSSSGAITIPMQVSYFVADDEPVISGNFVSTIGFDIAYK